MNIASFDLNLLKAADALLVESSVTRAAERTGVTQQAMSGQLKRLREIFNDALLIQTGRVLLPTPLGVALAPPIREALRQIERALATTPPDDLSRSAREFTIGSMTYAASLIIPSISMAFASEAPACRINVQPVSCPLLSGPSATIAGIKEGTTDAYEEAQAGGDHRQVA